MSSINPFSGYLAQSGHVEHTRAADRARQIRRAQTLSKDIAARDDQLEHQVENADAVTPANDQQPQGRQPPKQNPRPRPADTPTDEPPHVDLTA